jgi:hypothetical protein
MKKICTLYTTHTHLEVTRKSKIICKLFYPESLDVFLIAGGEGIWNGGQEFPHCLWIERDKRKLGGSRKINSD